MGETTIAAIHDSRANRAGSFSSNVPVRLRDMHAGGEYKIGDTYAEREINIYKTPKGTHAAAETTG